MEVEDPNQKTKKNHHRINQTDLNQRHKKEKVARNRKTKKIDHTLNQTDLNQRQ